MIEGDFFRIGKIFWLVKGLLHGKDWHVVIPRYIGSIKIKSLKDIMGFMHNNYWFMLNYDCFGRAVPVMKNNLAKPLLAKDLFTNNYGKLNSTEKEFVSFFINEKVELGLTGSKSIFHEGKDIDIIIYTKKPSEVIEILETLKKRGELKGGISMDNYGDRGLSEKAYAYLLKDRLLEGRYKGKLDYSIRIISDDEKVCTEPIITIGIIKEIKIIEAISPYTTPSIYYGVNDKGEKLKVYSHRITFNELKEGTQIKGMLIHEFNPYLQDFCINLDISKVEDINMI